MQARLEQEMRQRQELEAGHQRMVAQLEAERAERQAQAPRLTDIMEFLQGLGQCVGFSLSTGLLVPPPPPRPAATPVSMKVFYFCLCFACMASTFLD